MKQHNVVPLAASDNELSIAIVDPLDSFVVNAIEIFVGQRVSCRVGVPKEIQAAIERLYGSGKTAMDEIVADLDSDNEAASEQEVARLKDLASETPVVRLVNLIIQRAAEEGASDIHIEPFENQLKMRYRVDGMLREVEAPPLPLYPAVISRIKLMAKLDIAEHRLPQDGRIRAQAEGREIDMRISTVPTMHGESLVMRLLYKDSATLDFGTLGFSERTLKAFQAALQMPYGMLLVTGPTGSGKTTTLYAALTVLNQPTRKIVTVEDPVEYQVVGVNQIQVKPQIGLTFARALRSIVRQDPDVVMIGEMRDLETAEIAVQSALTGHLVLSTLHTNDAPSSVTRLLDMGVAGYLVTSVVNGVLAQRLVRKLCPHCRQAYQALPELVKQTRLDQFVAGGPATLYRATGCEHCRGTGYRGRVAIMEMLVMSDRIRSLVLKQADAREIAEAALAEGMETMYQDGLRKALAGLTSMEEVLRVTRED
jgi:general secretion pathway protein E